jgi:2-phospho-L-lactate guanylyltransferase
MNFFMWAVVPCKKLEFAKRRLAPILSAGERRCLVSAMLSDVLDVLTKISVLSGVAVISSDPNLADLARSFGVRCCMKDKDAGLSAALTLASGLLSNDGAKGILAVPGDLPLLAPGDVMRALEAVAASPAVALAPDNNNQGTNLLAMTPLGAIPYLFGGLSFQAHIAAARTSGIEPMVIQTEGLGLDIDTAEDLILFARERSPTRTFSYITETGIRDRLLLDSVNAPLEAGAGGE